MCKVVCAFNSDHSRHHRASRGRLLLLLLPAKTLGRETSATLPPHFTCALLVPQSGATFQGETTASSIVRIEERCNAQT